VAKLRVLGVGAGYFSQFQYLGWRNIADAECVAIVNRDAAKARTLADRYGIPEVLSDLDSALDKVKPDLVDLITPPATSAPHTPTRSQLPSLPSARRCRLSFTRTSGGNRGIGK
jgi:predicted dehydrogenase